MTTEQPGSLLSENLLTGASISPSCFCNSWLKQKVYANSNAGGRYTDADLANDMNALTFQERQKVDEEIHGVAAKVAVETEELITAKMKEMHEILQNLPVSTVRDAWDRAVFLRPSLATDRSLHLMFLRAREFDAFKAVHLLLRCYEVRKELWGEEKLIHRVTWDDLSEKEKQLVRIGAYRLISNRESTGRAIGLHRVRQWDTSDPQALLRSNNYIYFGLVEDDPEIFRHGLVMVVDWRGKWKSSKLGVVQYVASIAHTIDSWPHHLGATHLLYDEQNFESFLQGIRANFTRNHRIRNRLHMGSPIEVGYSLKSFGIDLTEYLSLNDEAGPLSTDRIEEFVKRRKEAERRYREAEAPYQDPSSPIALHPNPQDVILGRSKKIGLTWPGNIRYKQFIEEQAHRYLAEDDRKAKPLIVAESVQLFQTIYQARFLSRQETFWQVVEDSEVQKKVAQALRVESRAILNQMRQTIHAIGR